MKKPQTRFDMRVPADFLVEVDRWRAASIPIKSRAKAIVELTRAGMEADGKGRKRAKA